MSRNIISPSKEEEGKLLQYFNTGDYKNAEILAQEITNKYPNHPFGWRILSIILAMIGKFENSLIASQKLIEIAPEIPSSYINMGGSYQALGKFQDSEKYYRHAIYLDNRNLSANLNLGIVLFKLNRKEESEEVLKKVLLIDENNFNAHYYLGNIYSTLHENDKAIKSYEKALSIDSNHAQTYANLGSVFILNSKFDEAEKNCKKAISLNPNLALAYFNLGNIYKNYKEFDKAKKNYEIAIRHNSNYHLAFCNLGNIFLDTGYPKDAIKYYKKALKIKPNFVEALNNLGNSYRKIDKMKEAELSYREALRHKENYAPAYSNLLFLQSSISYDTKSHKSEAKNFARIFRKEVKKPFSSWSYNNDNLKVGFVSGDFYNHPVGFFLDSFLSELNNLNIEIFAYSNNFFEDNFTKRLRKNIHNWREIYDKNNKDTAELIYKDNLNILIDLSGHTAKNRLPIFIYKPAPIQLTWLGYWATTGISEIDYMLGDPYVAPKSEAHHFEEKIFNLPETVMCFSKPDFEIKIEPLPALSNKNITFGCFNDLGKMNKDVVEVRANILKSVKNSKLFLKNKQLNNDLVREDVLNRFSNYDISPDRIILEGSSSREKYLETYNKIDIALSPFPYGGVTTTAEGLWMGVPIIVMRGDRYISHVGESIVENVGLSEWVANDINDYVNKAVEFSSQIDKLSDIRESLRDKVLSSPLFDAKRFAISFEKTLLNIWKEYKKLNNKNLSNY